MLVLSRKLNESIIIAGDIRITIVAIRGGHVRVGIEAPESVGVMREELLERMAAPPSAEAKRREADERAGVCVPAAGRPA